MKLVHWIFSICLFTASWDLIFVVHVGGSLRLTQILVIPVCFAAVAKAIQDSRILWPRGATVLSLWVLTQFMLIPLSGSVSLALQFFVLLILTVAIVFCLVQLYGQSDRIVALMRVYMASFFATAVIGLVQFAMPVVGLPGILVSQWIVHGRLPRINGLNYEPSYFSTYIVIGWIMVLDLRLSKAEIAKGTFWKWGSIILGIALILCTSKTGWLIMIIELIARVSPRILQSIRRLARQVPEGRMSVPLPRLGLVLRVVIFIVCLMGGSIALFRVIDPLAFLGGSGLAGTPSHSVDARTDAFRHTLEIFLEHPLIGPSLGGVPVAIAAKQGITINDAAGVRLYWGSPVLLEVLTSTGVVLFIPFALFLYTTTFGAMRLARRRWPEERAKWLRALGRAMIFEWLMLFSEQNLLRIYLWYHFAMVILVAYHLEFAAPPLVAEERFATTSGLIEAGSAV
jgi:hypothetical protein